MAFPKAKQTRLIQEIASYTSMGWGASRIALQLGISRNTVRNYRTAYREDRVPLDRESILDMLTILLGQTESARERLAVLDRVIALSGELADGNRVSELLQSVKAAITAPVAGTSNPDTDD